MLVMGERACWWLGREHAGDGGESMLVMREDVAVAVAASSVKIHCLVVIAPVRGEGREAVNSLTALLPGGKAVRVGYVRDLAGIEGKSISSFVVCVTSTLLPQRCLGSLADGNEPRS